MADRKPSRLVSMNGSPAEDDASRLVSGREPLVLMFVDNQQCIQSGNSSQSSARVDIVVHVQSRFTIVEGKWIAFDQ